MLKVGRDDGVALGFDIPGHLPVLAFSCCTLRCNGVGVGAKRFPSDDNPQRPFAPLGCDGECVKSRVYRCSLNFSTLRQYRQMPHWVAIFDAHDDQAGCFAGCAYDGSTRQARDIRHRTISLNSPSSLNIPRYQCMLMPQSINLPSSKVLRFMGGSRCPLASSQSHGELRVAERIGRLSPRPSQTPPPTHSRTKI